LWLRFEPQMRSTRIAINFLFIFATNERKVLFHVKLFDHFLIEYLPVWAEIYRIFSQVLLASFHKISTRNSFWKMFHKLLALQGAPLSRFAKFCSIFCNFILSSYYAEKFWKHIHKYFHKSFVSSQGARPKRKHRKRYKEEKQGRSVFRKTSFQILFALGLGLITPYFFGVLIWSFSRHSLIVCIEL